MILKLVLLPLAISLLLHSVKSDCSNEVYNFKIDLEEDYDEQDGYGWAVNLLYNHVWFYADSWTGLDGPGIFQIRKESGSPGEFFEVGAYFAPYAEGHNFEFELKYYATTLSSLHNVIIDGEYRPVHYLVSSPSLEWTIIKFQAKGPLLLPLVPQLKIRITDNSDEFFLMEYLSTRICDESGTTATTEFTTLTTEITTEPTTITTEPTTLTTEITTEPTTVTTESTTMTTELTTGTPAICAIEVYNFSIDLEHHYAEQAEVGWAINDVFNHVWFYNDSWPGLDGAGVFQINKDSGEAGEFFDLGAYFEPYGEDRIFYFELKYYSKTLATLHNVTVDGESAPIFYLPPSTDLEWTVIKFESKGPLLPLPVPQLRVRLSRNDEEFFLMDYLSTRICDESGTYTVA